MRKLRKSHVVPSDLIEELVFVGKVSVVLPHERYQVVVDFVHNIGVCIRLLGTNTGSCNKADCRGIHHDHHDIKTSRSDLLIGLVLKITHL